MIIDLKITNHDFFIYRDSNNDVKVAKNYGKELKDLNRIVTMYLDYAKLQAENHNAMTMKDWVEKLNAFLQFNGKERLHNAGKYLRKLHQN